MLLRFFVSFLSDALDHDRNSRETLAPLAPKAKFLRFGRIYRIKRMLVVIVMYNKPFRGGLASDDFWLHTIRLTHVLHGCHPNKLSHLIWHYYKIGLCLILMSLPLELAQTACASYLPINWSINKQHVLTLSIADTALAVPSTSPCHCIFCRFTLYLAMRSIRTQSSPSAMAQILILGSGERCRDVWYSWQTCVVWYECFVCLWRWYRNGDERIEYPGADWHFFTFFWGFY